MSGVCAVAAVRIDIDPGILCRDFASAKSLWPGQWGIPMRALTHGCTGFRQGLTLAPVLAAVFGLVGSNEFSILERAGGLAVLLQQGHVAVDADRRAAGEIANGGPLGHLPLRLRSGRPLTARQDVARKTHAMGRYSPRLVAADIGQRARPHADGFGSTPAEHGQLARLKDPPFWGIVWPHPFVSIDRQDGASAAPNSRHIRSWP